MEVMLQKLPNGCLAPMGDEYRDMLAKYKVGAIIKCVVTQMRNGKFFRKWWVLVNYAFEIFKDMVEPMMYKGQPVQASFERFRKDLTILCGYYTAVFNAKGEMRIEANSLSWASMDEETFESFYSATIDVILGKTLVSTRFTPEQLREYVDNVMAFD